MLDADQGAHNPASLFGLEVPVYDAHHVEVVQCQSQLRKVELDVLLGEHHLLGQTSEEVSTSKKLQYQVELSLRLKCCNKRGSRGRG